MWNRIRSSFLLRNSAAMLVTRALSILLGVALTVLLARWLGPEAYGAYLYTINVAYLLALPVIAGLPTLVIREIAVARGKDDGGTVQAMMRWAALFTVLTSLTVLGAYFITWALRGVPPGDGTIYALSMPLIFALAFMQISAAIVQGYERPFLSSLPDGLIRPSLLLIFVGGALFLGTLSAASAIVLHMGAAFLAGLWAIFVAQRIRRAPENALSTTQRSYRTSKWMKALLPLTLIVAAATLLNRIDILMLGYLTDTTEVARYGIAVQIAGMVVLLPMIVNQIVQPRIARMHAKGDHAGLTHLVTNGARLSLVSASASALVLLLISRWVIITLVGPEYETAFDVLVILGAGKLAVSFFGPVGNLLNMTDNAGQNAKLMGIFAVVNAVLNWLLIPPLGGAGAAYATATSLVLMHAALAWQARRILRIDASALGLHPQR